MIELSIVFLASAVALPLFAILLVRREVRLAFTSRKQGQRLHWLLDAELQKLEVRGERLSRQVGEQVRLICRSSDPSGNLLQRGCLEDLARIRAAREELAGLRPGLDHLHGHELAALCRRLALVGSKVAELRLDLNARAETWGSDLGATALEPVHLVGIRKLLPRWVA